MGKNVNSDFSFSKIVKSINEEYEKTILLQFINGYFYPTNSISKNILYSYNLSRIPEDKLDIWSPKLVRDGYKLAINNFNPTQKNSFNRQKGLPIGGEPHPVKNPCSNCKINGLCGSDDCGRKLK